MNPRPTRQTVEGRAYLELQNLARRTGRPTDELHQIYALEGFLDRLTQSAHAERFVLKGGVLLGAYDARRPTRDIDLSARTIANETGVIRDVIAQVLEGEVDDGLSFDPRTVSAETIRDQDDYGGVRVSVKGRLAAANATSTSTSTSPTRSPRPPKRWRSPPPRRRDPHRRRPHRDGARRQDRHRPHRSGG